MNTVTFRGTPKDLRKLLADLPRLLTGKVPDPYRVARGFRTRLGSALLGEVQRDFVTKSRGGTGRDGVKWPPLAPGTLAARRRKSGGAAVEILHATGDLYRSLSPGVEGRPSAAPGQVMRLSTNRVVAGSSRKPWHHRGGKHLPARPMWPASGKIPKAWKPALKVAMKRGVAAIVQEYVRRGAR